MSRAHSSVRRTPMRTYAGNPKEAQSRTAMNLGRASRCMSSVEPFPTARQSIRELCTRITRTCVWEVLEEIDLWIPSGLVYFVESLEFAYLLEG